MERRQFAEFSNNGRDWFGREFSHMNDNGEFVVFFGEDFEVFEECRECE